MKSNIGDDKGNDDAQQEQVTTPALTRVTANDYEAATTEEECSQLWVRLRYDQYPGIVPGTDRGPRMYDVLEYESRNPDSGVSYNDFRQQEMDLQAQNIGN